MTGLLKLLLSVCLFFADGFLVNAFAVPTCRAISRRLHAKSEWQQDAYSSEKETDSGTENKQDDWQISDDFEGVTGDYDGTYFDDDDDEMVTGWNKQEQEDTEATSSHFFSRKDLYDPAFYNDKLVFEKLCQGVNLSSPSKIQAMAWPNLLQGKSAVIADQTGSGKTLAYLMPLIQRLKQSNLRPRVGTPKILVLAPTAELADQTFAVCNKLSTKLPSLSTMVVTATGNLNTSIRDQIRILQRKNMDILISTPGRIATILRTRQSGLDLSQLQALVLDEVDILWTDETFGPQLRTIGAAVTAETQFVFCTATLPDVVLTKVKQEFGNVMKIQGPGLHRVAPTIQERLIDVSVPARHNRDSQFCFNVKTRALLQALRTTRCRRTLVFCNTVESCRKVENLLNRRDRKGQVYRVYPYHNAMTAPARNENLRDFSNDESNDAILVCTDRAARGVDFAAAPVDHVVIFDFPRDPAEYIRRVGRTARAGRQGASTVLAYGWQLPIARSVMGKKVAVVESSVMDDFASTGGGDVDVDDSRIPKRAKRGQSAEDSIREKIERGRMWKEQKERIV